MRKIVLTFGLIAGAILSAMMLLTMPFLVDNGFERGMIIGYTTMVLAFLMIFFGVRSYRDNVVGGTIGFGRALTIGLLITLVATVCYVATWELMFFKLTPQFGDRYQSYLMEQDRKAGKSEAELAVRREELDAFMRRYRNPLVNSAYTFVEPLPVGLLFTVVSAAVLSRKRRVDDAIAV